MEAVGKTEEERKGRRKAREGKKIKGRGKTRRGNRGQRGGGCQGRLRRGEGKTTGNGKGGLGSRADLFHERCF